MLGSRLRREVNAVKVRRSPRWMIAVAACGLTLAATAFAVTRAAGYSAASAAEAGRFGPRWSAREAYSYAIALEGGAKLPSGNAAFAMELGGTLRLWTLSHEGGKVTLLARVDDPVMKLGGRADAEAQAIAASLRKEAVFVFAGGQVSDAWYDRELSNVAISTWRTLMSALQFTTTEGEQQRWSAEELDSSGRYKASYERTADGAVVRRKTEYVALLTPRASEKPLPPQFLPRIERAEARFDLGEGLLRGVKVSELAASRFDERSSLEVENKLSLELRPETMPAPAFDLERFQGRALHLSPASPAPTSRGDSRAYDRLRTEGKRFTDVVAELERQASSGKPAWSADVDPTADPDAKPPDELKERTEVLGSLVAFLRSQPETAPLALQHIRAQSSASDALVSGLAAAGTEVTRDALLSLLRDDTSSARLRLRAMVGLSHHLQPGAETAAAFTALLGDPQLGGQALLSLGSLSRRLRDAGQAQQADAIGVELAHGLEAASDTPSRARALRAISNSGDSKLLPLIKASLDLPDRELRAAAADGLRHMQSSEAEALLAARLKVEDDPEVQHAILRAAKTRGASPVLAEALSICITKGPTANIRRRAVELARLWVKTQPSLGAALEQAKLHDPDPEVRAAAGQLG